jgi:hypothetical protein
MGGGISMTVPRCVVALIAVLALATRAMSAEIDVPRSSRALIVLSDGSEVRVGSSVRIEATAHAIAEDRATGRMELRGEVQIKIVRDGFEAVTIATSSAVITRVPPEDAR